MNKKYRKRANRRNNGQEQLNSQLKAKKRLRSSSSISDVHTVDAVNDNECLENGTTTSVETCKHVENGMIPVGMEVAPNVSMEPISVSDGDSIATSELPPTINHLEFDYSYSHALANDTTKSMSQSMTGEIFGFEDEHDLVTPASSTIHNNGDSFDAEVITEEISVINGIQVSNDSHSSAASSTTQHNSQLIEPISVSGLFNETVIPTLEKKLVTVQDTADKYVTEFKQELKHLLMYQSQNRNGNSNSSTASSSPAPAESTAATQQNATKPIRSTNIIRIILFASFAMFLGLMLNIFKFIFLKPVAPTKKS